MTLKYYVVQGKHVDESADDMFTFFFKGDFDFVELKSMSQIQFLKDEGHTEAEIAALEKKWLLPCLTLWNIFESFAPITDFNKWAAINRQKKENRLTYSEFITNHYQEQNS